MNVRYFCLTLSDLIVAQNHDSSLDFQIKNYLCYLPMQMLIRQC